MSVFISWSGADRDVKNVIAEKLRGENITFWESDENCASDFSSECIENIRRSTIFLVIISDASMSPKSYVFNEVIEARNMENEGRLNIVVYKITDAPYTERFSMQLNHISDANHVSRVYRLGNSGGLDTLIKRVKYLMDRREKGVPEKPFDVLVPKVFGVPVTATGYFVRDSRRADMTVIDAAFSTSNVVILSKLFGFGKKSTIRQYVRNHNYTSATEVQASNHSLRGFFLNDLQFTNVNDGAFDKADERAILQTKFDFLKKLDERHLIIVSDVVIEEDADEFVVHLLSSLRCHIVLVTQNSADAYRDHFPIISIDRMETKFLLELFFHYYDRDSTVDREPLIPALNCFFDDIGGHTKTVEIAASVLSKEMRANPDDLIRYLTEGSDDNRTLNDRIFGKLSNLIAMESFSDEAKRALVLISLVADPIIEDSELYRYMKLCGLRSRSVITELDSLRWITYNPSAHTIYIEPVIGRLCISNFLDSYSIPLALFEEIRVSYETCAARDLSSVYGLYTMLEHFFRSLRLDESADIVKIFLEQSVSASADIERIDRVCDRFKAWFKEIRESVGEELTERERFMIRSSVWIVNSILPYIKAMGSFSLLWSLDTSHNFSIESLSDSFVSELCEFIDDPISFSEFESIMSDPDDGSNDENKALVDLYNSFMSSFVDKDISALSKQVDKLIDLLQNTPEYLMLNDFSDRMIMVVKALYQSCSATGAYQTGVVVLEKFLSLDWQNYYMHQILLLYAKTLFHINSTNDEILSVMIAADDLLPEIENDQSLTHEVRENLKREHLLIYSAMLASCNQVDEAIERFNEFLSLGIDVLYGDTVECVSVIVDQLMLQKRTDEAVLLIEQVMEFLHSCSEKENLAESVKETAQSLLSLREMYIESRETEFSAGGIITEKNYYQRYSSDKKNSPIKMMAYNRVANDVRRFDFSSYTDAELAAHTEKLRARARAGEKAMKLAPEAFALVSEAGFRTLGYRHHQVQYIGAAVMLDGGIAEIINGEGKTYTITLVAFVNSLYSDKTFVLDDSKYLTERNYKWMRGLYKLLGLEVGRLIPGRERLFDEETGTENVIYSDITTFAFNLLYRERSMNLADRRDLSCCSVIIDEADTILIECADRPYIIIKYPRSSRDYFNKCVDAYKLALRFNDSELYCTFNTDTIEFKREAYSLLEECFGVNYDDIANSQELVKLEKLVRKALFALRSVKGIDYFVKDGKVFGENESNGSVSIVTGEWGLFLSLANGLDVSNYESSLSERKIYRDIIHPFGLLQRFGTVSGTSATACSFKKEFKTIYGLDVVAVPPVFPVKRTDRTVRLYLKKQFKDRAIVDMIKEKHAKAQPVLLIVKNLSESYHFSQLLTECGITHNALNAINSEQSPELLASAGMPNSVLVATQIANRGVDIKLGGDAERMTMFELVEQGADVSRMDEILYTVPSAETLESELYRRYTVTLEKKRALVAANRKKVIESGGLCVISSEPYGDMRIEQQIRGRAGRQGAVGESYIFESVEDELYTYCFGTNQAMLAHLINSELEVVSSNLLTRTAEGFKKKVHHKSFEKMQRAADSSGRLEGAKIAFLELIDEIRTGKSTHEDLIRLWSDHPDNFNLAHDILEKGDCKESTVKLLFRNYPNIFVKGRHEEIEEYLYEAAIGHVKSRVVADLQDDILLHMLDSKFEEYITAMFEFESTYKNKKIKNGDSFFVKTYETDLVKYFVLAIDSWIRIGLRRFFIAPPRISPLKEDMDK